MVAFHKYIATRMNNLLAIAIYIHGIHKSMHAVFCIAIKTCMHATTVYAWLWLYMYEGMLGKSFHSLANPFHEHDVIE